MTFQLISEIVGKIVGTIEQTAIVAVKTLKANVFGVRVTNPTTKVEVKGTVTVGNQKNVESKIKDLGSTLKDIRKAVISFKPPDFIKVSNFPDFPKSPEFPKSFKVSNFPKVEYPKEIKISNQTDLTSLNVAINKVTGEIKKLKLDPKINVQAPKPDRLVVPPANVMVKQQEIDYKKLSKAIAQQMPELDYQKLAETIGKEIAAMTVSTGGGGSGGKYAFQDTQGNRGYGLTNILRQLSVVQEERWGINDTFKSGTITYSGEEDVDGNWIVRKITKGTGTVNMAYATVKNNPLVTNYTDAWDNRVTLTFNSYSIAFALE